jgi:transposase-like protein
MAQEPHKSQQFKCHECGQTFNSEQEQRRHQETAHSGTGKAKGAAQGQSHGNQGKQ